MSDATINNDIAAFQQKLNSYHQEIASCIEKSNWDVLNTVLTERQWCLEQMVDLSLPQNFPDEIKMLALSILERDAVFLAKILQQKQLISDELSFLELGKRALKAYCS